jgi:elongation factor G
MKEYKTEQVRNIVLLSHQSAGKTSLVESMLLASGALTRAGRVEDGNTVADFDPEAIERKISLSAAVVAVEWKGYKINLLDTPGTFDFVGEVKQAVRVADGALFLVDSVAGVEVGTELTWAYADERSLPRMVVVNKMDRENASFERALGALRERFPGQFVPMFLPIGSQSTFEGVVDVVKRKAFLGPQGTAANVPAAMADQAEEARVQLIEAAAEGDDELIIKYLDGQELTDEEIRAGLCKSIASGSLIPVLCAGGVVGGVSALIDAMVDYLPTPPAKVVAFNPVTDQQEEIDANAAGPLMALVFKTTVDPYGKQSYFRVFGGTLQSDSRVFNASVGEEERLGQLSVPRGKEQFPIGHIAAGDIGVVSKLSSTNTGNTLCDKGRPLRLPGTEYPVPIFSVAVSPKTKADSAKMGAALSRLVEEDPSFEWHLQPSTSQTILSGMGDAHIDIASRRLKRKFGVEVVTSVPKVPYQETVTRKADTTYRHKKQTGGAGQFAQVSMRLEPVESGTGFVYEWEVFGGAVSSSFRPSIEKGIRSVLEGGVLAGYPVIDVFVAITDGKEHPVDSKDIAFQIAGREGFKEAFLQAGPVLKEPICEVTITVPEEYMGDVLSDLNTRRGRVLGMNQQHGRSIVNAEAPLAEMQRYSTTLRALTQGRGVYTLKIARYEVVPSHLAENIIAESKKEAAQAG